MYFAAVPFRSADDEPARGIDEVFRIPVRIRRDNGIYDVLFQVFDEAGTRHALVVLRAQHHCIRSYGTGTVVSDGDLRLAVGTEIGQQPAFTHFGEFSRELVREHRRKRHELFRLRAGVTEHHALVARAQLFHAVRSAFAALERAGHGLAYIRGLPVHAHFQLASAGVQPFFAAVVAYRERRFAGYRFYVYVRRARHLAEHHDEIGGRAHFRSHAAERIGGKSRVEYAVGDEVAHFIGVTFRNAL